MPAVQPRPQIAFALAPARSNCSITATFPEAILPALRDHRYDQLRRRLALGRAYEDHGLICCWDDGKPFRPDTVTHQFTVIMRKLELGVTFHALRKTHSSLLQADGENPKVVSSRLGHKGVAITLDTYTEVTPEQDRAAANRMNRRLVSLLDSRNDRSALVNSPEASAS